jgi:hypothetical protein
MTSRLFRLTTAALVLAASLFGARASLATTFTVHGYDLGEKITLVGGQTVWTAELDVTLQGIADHVSSFCVDLYTSIGPGTYLVNDVLDAYGSASPIGEATRNLAWAGHVVDNFGNVDLLVAAGITRDQAITGVQAAIWEGIYGGGKIVRSSLSAGAQLVYDRIMATKIQGDGPALVVDLRGWQDQVIRGGSNAVPEPSAALVFGLGTLVAGSLMRRRVA